MKIESFRQVRLEWTNGRTPGQANAVFSKAKLSFNNISFRISENIVFSTLIIMLWVLPELEKQKSKLYVHFRTHISQIINNCMRSLNMC